MYGLSPLAKHYWSHGNLGTDPPPIILEDLADLNLRETIQEVCKVKHYIYLFMIIDIMLPT